MPDPAAVNSMFGRIARRYDFANLLLSCGIDSLWRRRLIEAVRHHDPATILDLATGSGDVAFALGKELAGSATITGMDFCQPMLDQAEAKKKRGAPAQFSNVTFRVGDALELPLANESYDAVTIAFGLRNLADRTRGLRQMHRVLRTGGRLYILEFSQPSHWLRPFYYFYLRRVLPLVAGIVTGDRAAYVYLNDTIAEFPGHKALTEEISAIGFKHVRVRRMTFGIVALHEGEK